MNPAPGHDPLPLQLKHFIVNTLKLRDTPVEKISDDEPLIGGTLGLDSLDALSLAMSLEDEFGVTIHSRAESHQAFASVTSLAGFIRAHAPPVAVVRPAPAIQQATAAA